MKYLNPAFTILISLVILVHGCKQNKIHQKTDDVQLLTNLSTNKIPHKIYVHADSLLIRIPGRDGIKLPEKISAPLPGAVEAKGIIEITPGASFLPQTEKEKLAGDLPVKSKKPEIITIVPSKHKNQSPKEYQPPIIYTLPQAINIHNDSLSIYEKIAIESGLITIQHNDSIFPPISLPAVKPQHLKALPFKHKDDAIFDIRLLNDDQELPNSFIRAIVKDNHGNIWFGTHTGGLISYDGHFFTQYKTNNGLSSDMILSLLMDKKNNLWIGTFAGGVVYFDGKKIIRYTKKQGLQSNSILTLLEDNKGNIWVATTNGVSLFDGKTISTYTIDQGLANNVVLSLFEDDKGNIWFGTNGSGVTKYNGKEFVTFTKNDGMASDIILAMTQDHQGNIWFGTNGGGVSKFNGQSFTNYGYSQGLGSDVILSIIEDSDENMWFGTFGNGITQFNGKTFSHYTTNEGLSDDYVRTLFEDETGNIWIGTDGGGVSNFNIHSFSHFTKQTGLNNNLILSVFQDNRNRLWFGSFEGGVMIFDEPKHPGAKNTYTNITTEHGLSNNIVISIMQDNQNNFWFGTYGGGVSKLDGKSLEAGKLKFTNYSTENGLNNNIVRSVLQDNNGDIWFGTEGGATKFNGNEFVTMMEKSGLGSNNVLCIFEDQAGALWFGTMDGGVSRFENDTLFRYTNEHGIGNNSVWTITQDNNGTMWFGTDGGGLTCYNGHYFRTFNTEDGLSNNYVFSLISDDNNSVWAGTVRGLNQIKIPDSLPIGIVSFLELEPRLINYGKKDGLKGLDFYTNAVFHDNKNRLWWGTDKVLSMLDLNTFKTHEEAPIVQINDLIINNKNITFNKLKSNNEKNSLSGIRFKDVSPFSHNPIGLNLPYQMNHLTFHFSAIDWSAPHLIQYQYKLLGFDQEWSLPTNDNLADYGNIPPGHYTFQLRAIGKSGSWSKTLEYPFVIRYPWWLAWWAIIIYVIAFVFLIWLLIRSRVNIVQRQKNILENLIFDRTKELDTALTLAEQAAVAKSQFIATISHEIRTPLNAIMGLTHLALVTSENNKQENYLQKIDRSAITLLSLINDILDFSKIEAGKMELETVNFDIEIVLNSIIIINAQLARENNLEFVINIHRDVPRKLIGDPLRIGQVLTNLCSNAIKFTPSGEVVLNIEISEKISEEEIRLKITVVDTGIGISEDQIPLLFDEFKQADSSITRKFGGTGLGLTISKLLIEMMDGHIWLESKIGVGTTFFFDCKVGVQPEKSSPEIIIPEELKEFEMLVCDNNTSALKSLVTTLQSFSLNADAISSSEEVLKQLEKKSYDLLLIDLELNGMSGIDVINLIQENPNLPTLKTILISDSEKCKTIFEQKITGIDGYLTKPSIPSVVLEKVLSVFGMEKISSPQRDTKQVHLKRIEKALSGKCMLLAEDNEINRQVVFELVNNVGVKVEVADNGAIALQKVMETHFDIILMDLHMPVMDGYNASTQIRNLNISTPIIAITADAMDDSIKSKCNFSGINDIITKPIDPDLLYDKLLKWLCPELVSADNDYELTEMFESQLSNIVISDLDIQSGIRRFGGNKDLYMKMLKKFLSTNGQTCVELGQLIRQGEFERAQIKIHTLKGESGNIGAVKVAKLSQQVELAIINKDVPGFEKKLLVLETSIEEIREALQNYFQETTHSIEKDPQSIRELIKELMECLNLKNPKAFDLIDELTENGAKRSDIDAITKAVNNENIAEALYLLKKLSEKH
ncbi:MAG: response regulator [Bacteroidetes bacterium]|nr:response regulator [Bacteroidota bacterium]MBL6944596.1 response regulator [Bacteroidales bacterium]